ncbi:actin-related protein 2/3 complex subunit 5 [Chytriomyces sp. MP71]|nr:actin-related protein 2/3 complex subunit 5 [Chytriomyces sp. MP71]
MEALAGPRPADIPAVVKQLPHFQLDILMKFVYRGMAFPELYNSSVLLTWHEKVTEVTGLGSIVRVMSDRLTV